GRIGCAKWCKNAHFTSKNKNYILVSGYPDTISFGIRAQESECARFRRIPNWPTIMQQEPAMPFPMNPVESMQTTVFRTDEQRWEAVGRRDASADGSFVFSVRTTGVYCRPSCPSRRARREHVAFHADPEEAEAAGFRP